jgi:hypothetical protein
MRISVGGRYAAAFCLVAGLSLAACTDSGTKNSGASTGSTAGSSTAAATTPEIAGMWKISEPTSSLKPVSGEVPFTAEGKAAYESNKANYDKGAFDEYDYVQSRCSSPGTPRLMITPDPFRIWVTPTQITFQFQWNRNWRQVELPGMYHMAGNTPSMGRFDAFGTMLGEAKGQWEGDTLVVTTTKLSGTTLIDNLVPHGYDTKITERIRLTDKDTLEDHMTIEDAEYFTKPWEAVVTYKRQPDTALPEDVCFDRLVSGQLPLPK